MKFPRLSKLRLPTVYTKDFRDSLSHWLDNTPFIVRFNDEYRAVILSPDQMEDILDKLAGSPEKEVILEANESTAEAPEETTSDIAPVEGRPQETSVIVCEKDKINSATPCLLPATHRVQIAARNPDGSYTYPEVALCDGHYTKLTEAQIAFDKDETI